MLPTRPTMMTIGVTYTCKKLMALATAPGDVDASLTAPKADALTFRGNSVSDRSLMFHPGSVANDGSCPTHMGSAIAAARRDRQPPYL